MSEKGDTHRRCNMEPSYKAEEKDLILGKTFHSDIDIISYLKEPKVVKVGTTKHESRKERRHDDDDDAILGCGINVGQL